MTTTDAETIAQEVGRAVLRVEQMFNAKLIERAKARVVDDATSAILSYLASRLEVDPHVSEPVYKAVERILDEKSAWVARPNDEVTKSIAFQAVVAAHKIIAESCDICGGQDASRREAQEPVAWRVTYADGDTVYLHHKPTGDSGVYECTPLYTTTPSPAPAGEVERLRAALEEE